MKKALLIGTIATFAALGLVVLAPVAFAGSGTQNDPFGPGDKVVFCHYDGSDNGGGGSGKYNQPDASTTATGPAGHIGHAFDVIPSYFFQQNANAQVQFYGGVNWPTLNNLPSSPVDFTPLLGSSAATFIASGCAEPVVSTTTTTTTVVTTTTTPPPVHVTTTTPPPVGVTTTTTAPPPTGGGNPPPGPGGNPNPPPNNNPPNNNPPLAQPPSELAFTGIEDVLPIGATVLALATTGGGLMWLGRKRRYPTPPRPDLEED